MIKSSNSLSLFAIASLANIALFEMVPATTFAKDVLMPERGRRLAASNDETISGKEILIFPVSEKVTDCRSAVFYAIKQLALQKPIFKSIDAAKLFDQASEHSLPLGTIMIGAANNAVGFKTFPDSTQLLGPSDFVLINTKALEMAIAASSIKEGDNLDDARIPLAQVQRSTLEQYVRNEAAKTEKNKANLVANFCHKHSIPTNYIAEAINHDGKPNILRLRVPAEGIPPEQAVELTRICIRIVQTYNLNYAGKDAKYNYYLPPIEDQAKFVERMQNPALREKVLAGWSQIAALDKRAKFLRKYFEKLDDTPKQFVPVRTRD